MYIFSLFETHPEVHDAFMSFRAINTTELEYNAILRAHALRVMGTVDKCIYRLDNRDKLRELMTELGIRHKNYTVKVEFIDVSSNALLFDSCGKLQFQKKKKNKPMGLFSIRV